MSDSNTPERQLRQAQWQAEKNPDSPSAWADLAVAFLGTKQLPEALTVYQRLLGMRDQEASEVANRACDRLDAACQAFVESGPEAEQALTEAIEIAGDDFAVPHRLMGILLAKRGGYIQALPHLARAEAARDDAADTYYWLGRCEYERGRLDGAWRYWATCLKMAPDHGSARAGLEALNRAGVLGMGVAEPATAGSRLSACLIVKDEAKNLGRCLSSLAGLADEIVVVDTGSTDETVAIAKAVGAKVANFPWCDDFAAARNASLELATGDWILVIDADEELVVRDVEAFKQALATEAARVYRLTIDNVEPDGRIESRYTSTPRLFRRYPGVKFSGRLHETIWPFLKQVGWNPSVFEAAYIRHHGYTPAALAEKDKLARNRHLAVRMTEDAPKDPLGWYYLASVCYLARDMASALEALGQVRRLRDYGRELESGHRRSCYLLEAWVYKHLEQTAQLASVLDEGLFRFPGYPEFHYERGLLRAANGDAAGAIADFEACLEGASDGEWSDLRAGIAGYLAHSELAGLLLAQGQQLEAAEHLAAAADDPTCPVAEAEQMRALVATLTAAPAPPPPAPQPVAPPPPAAPVAEAPAPVAVPAPAVPAGAGNLVEEGYEALKRRDLEGALRAASRAIEADAGEAEAYALLGHVLEAAGQPVYAERAFSQAIAFAPARSDWREARLKARHALLGAAMPASLANLVDKLLSLAHPTVAGCVTVSGEAPTLARVLASLEGWVDEVLVVDAGADAAALEQARALGARVVPAPIDQALQIAGRSARADWMLVLEPHEALEVVDAAAWSRLLRDRRSEAVSLSGHARLIQRQDGALAAGASVAESAAARIVGAAPVVLEARVPAADAKAAVFARLDQNPRDPVAYGELAGLFAAEGAFDKALLAAGQAIEMYATAAHYHLLGTLLETLEQPAWAERAYRTALYLDPDHPDAGTRRLACRGMAQGDELPPEQAAAIERLLTRAEPVLSACLIVRDEAENLGKCLASLAGVADEIVVVDTGSRDETVAIARAAGAKVSHFAWCDDFAAARNASLELATGDWILVIDADEELVVHDQEAFKQALRCRVPGGYILAQRNLDGRGGELANPAMRLFQRLPEIRYAGRVHEDVAAAVEAATGHAWTLEAVSLLHRGYLPEVVAARGKWERNLRITEAEVLAQPESASAWYDYGRALACLERPDALEAMLRAERLLAAGQGRLSNARLLDHHRLLSGLLTRSGQREKAIESLATGLSRLGDHPELYSARGLLLLEIGDARGARADFEACLAALPQWPDSPLRREAIEALLHAMPAGAGL